MAKTGPSDQSGSQSPKPGSSNTQQASGRLTAGLPPSVTEIGGPKGPEPTRYGDWERNGRCIDF